MPHSLNESSRCAHDYGVFSAVILNSFVKMAHERTSARAKFSVDCVARGIDQLHAIVDLADKGNFLDGWALCRTLYDRLFLYQHLARTDEFEVFSDWCFKRSVEYRNLAISASEFKGRFDPAQFVVTSQEKERYRRISQDPRVTKWRRPKPEASAKAGDLDFLYHFGYDYASQYVHPVMGDGIITYHRILHIPLGGLPQDDGLLNHTTIMVLLLLLQECMVAAGVLWRGIVQTTQDAFLDALANQSYTGYEANLVRFLRQGPNVDLHEWRSTPLGSR